MVELCQGAAKERQRLRLRGAFPIKTPGHGQIKDLRAASVSTIMKLCTTPSGAKFSGSALPRERLAAFATAWHLFHARRSASAVAATARFCYLSHRKLRS
jgi:hypothetical protein